MSGCRLEAILWKQRRGVRLSNDEIEITILTGGGHIADFRLCGSPVNALWEAPWPTIEPGEFSSTRDVPLYGEYAVGRMLASYTGHALALGYFGMPTRSDLERGLTLHGEAAVSEWHVTDSQATTSSAKLTLEVELPLSGLRFRRTITLAAGKHTVEIAEQATNLRPTSRPFQWVEHAAFGEPLFAPPESTLVLSGDRGVTWPLGYEGHALLHDSREFHWPRLDDHDLSQPFLKRGTGFVAAVRVVPRDDAFAAVHNRKMAITAGYVFNPKQFPWIALWEENCARTYPPWNGVTRVRGVEFGSSPMPLGLEYAQQVPTLFGTPTFIQMGANEEKQANYSMFITAVPPDWQRLESVSRRKDTVVLQSDGGAELLL